MQDLNDLYYFAEVVAHGGFAPAGRALRQPKSKLSRRVAQLEDRLGVRLIERSTRRFRVTDVGQAFYERCRSMLIEADGAEAVVAEAQGEPHGMVRFSCPTGLLEAIRHDLSPFLIAYPRVRLHIVATNRPVDLIDEKVDVALRVRATLDSDASLTMRTLGPSHRILVAAPAIALTIPPDADIDGIAALPTLSAMEQAGEEQWTFTGRDGARRTVRHQPRISCSEMMVLRSAAIDGLGIALLPDHFCRNDIRDGRLLRVFPEWSTEPAIIHLLFTTRRGLPPAVRAFIDYLAALFHDRYALLAAAAALASAEAERTELAGQ